MIDNNYMSLYNTTYYEMKLYYMMSDTTSREVQELLSNIALANTIYYESKKCFSMIKNKIRIDKESNVIYSILETYPHVYNILKDIMETENITYTKGNITYLQVAVMVCEEHMKNMNNVIHK